GLLDAESAYARAVDLTRRGAAHFRARGIDLDGYTTVESADDIDALRSALGTERMRLFGFSYGTHLALATIRRHGERVAGAILAATEGPDHTYKLPLTMDTQIEKIARAVAADPRIARDVPDFTALLDRALARLERDPLEVEVRDPTGEPLRLRVGSFGLRWLLRFDVGDASDIPVFPRLLHSIERGDPSVLRWFVQKRTPILYGVNLMSIIMDAASGASPGRRARIRAQAERSRFADVVNGAFPEVGEAAGAPDLGDAYRAPIVSDVPVLFLSGTMDFNTPPFQAEEVRWGFRRSAHVIVEHAGHEQIIGHPRAQAAISAFLRGEEVRDELARGEPLRFVPLEGYDPEATHPAVPRP
ncbi:MAG: alpha/beta hydrolase, partial [Gemmatimonadota bacterium]|nr:alpha/beta hydrolase [Gemmatimonadota bacterium]